MKITRLACILLACLAVTLPTGAFGQTEANFDAFFTDNMVLQKSPNTRLSGTGPANQWFWVQFKMGRKRIKLNKEAQADSSGNWTMSLDLSKPELVGTGDLILTVAKKSGFRSGVEARALTNVAIGQVWLLVARPDQGVPANPKQLTIAYPERIRFLDLRSIEIASDSSVRNIPPWQGCPAPADYSRFSTLAIRLGHMLTTTTTADFVGVVQLTPKDIQRGFTPGAPEQAEIKEWMARRWAWINEPVRQEQTNCWNILLDAKRQGKVIEMHPVYEYDLPACYAPGAFSRDKFPAAFFDFSGVLWCRSPQAPGAQP